MVLPLFHKTKSQKLLNLPHKVFLALKKWSPGFRSELSRGLPFWHLTLWASVQ